jgi:hypothetical protein
MKKLVWLLLLGVILLLPSCISSTLIDSIPSGATVYLNGRRVGITPYIMTDAKILGSTTSVVLEKEGFEKAHTYICRDERLDPFAILGGFIFYVPFLWSLKYEPFHTYELIPLPLNNEPPVNDNMTSPSMIPSKIDKLRELKQLFDEKLITQEEYDAQRKKVLEQ